MKAIIENVEFVKEYDSKHGKLYSYRVTYDGRQAYYSSKSKDQKKFIPGKEAEFTEETRTGTKGNYVIIKPVYQNRQSNFGKALNREQARYSAMCVSYAKDLVIGGRIPLEELSSMSWIMFELIKEMDKTLSD